MTSPPPDPDRLQQRKQTMKRLFFVLLAVGLVGGALLSVGVINLLTRFGLTDNRPQQIQNAVPASSPTALPS